MVIGMMRDADGLDGVSGEMMINRIGGRCSRQHLNVTTVHSGSSNREQGGLGSRQRSRERSQVRCKLGPDCIRAQEAKRKPWIGKFPEGQSQRHLQMERTGTPPQPRFDDHRGNLNFRRPASLRQPMNPYMLRRVYHCSIS